MKKIKRIEKCYMATGVIIAVEAVIELLGGSNVVISHSKEEV
jgi:hypothetical protein